MDDAGPRGFAQDLIWESQGAYNFTMSKHQACQYQMIDDLLANPVATAPKIDIMGTAEILHDIERATGKFARAAIEAAVARQEEITPGLLRIVWSLRRSPALRIEAHLPKLGETKTVHAEAARNTRNVVWVSSDSTHSGHPFFEAAVNFSVSQTLISVSVDTPCLRAQATSLFANSGSRAVKKTRRRRSTSSFTSRVASQ